MSATAQVPAADLSRLIKLLGMLGSDHDGEIAAAGRKAHQWVRAHKTTWEALLTPREVVVVRPQPDAWKPPRPSHASWQDCARVILGEFDDVLKGERERDFLASLLKRNPRKLTEKQEEWLRDIAWRAGLSW